MLSQTMDATVRDWYNQTYPDDEMGAHINPVMTFADCIDVVPTGDGFYHAIGVYDSLVRERVFKEFAQRSGIAYDEIYDSWLNEEPLPGRTLLDAVYGSEMSDGVAVGVGYAFTMVSAGEVARAGIELRESGTVVTLGGKDYPLMKGATYGDSRKVDALLDSHGELRVGDYRKAQAVSLKGEAALARQASEQLAGDAVDAPDIGHSAPADMELL